MIDTRQEALYRVSERSALPQAKEGKPTKRKFEILRVKKTYFQSGMRVRRSGVVHLGGCVIRKIKLHQQH